MKKIATLLAALAFLAVGPVFGAASVARPELVHITDQGVAWPALRESLDSGSGKKPYLIHLDTLEVDTGYIVFNILGSPIYAYNDTVGSVSLTCKDSTATDTIAIIMKWQGNTRPDGKGVWANMDSVELKDLGASGAAAQGVYRDTTKVVVNSGRYSALRFFLKNKLATNVNRKATCKDALFIHRRRLGPR